MSNAHATNYLNETVLYGGLPVRRADMERDLDRLNVSGPARLRYGSLPAVDMEPVEMGQGR